MTSGASASPTGTMYVQAASKDKAAPNTIIFNKILGCGDPVVGVSASVDSGHCVFRAVAWRRWHGTDQGSSLGERTASVPAGPDSPRSSGREGWTARAMSGLEVGLCHWVRYPPTLISTHEEGTHLGLDPESKGRRIPTGYHGNRRKCYFKAISRNYFQYINILGNDEFTFITSLTFVTILFASSGFSEVVTSIPTLVPPPFPLENLPSCNSTGTRRRWGPEGRKDSW